MILIMLKKKEEKMSEKTCWDCIHFQSAGLKWLKMGWRPDGCKFSG